MQDSFGGIVGLWSQHLQHQLPRYAAIGNLPAASTRLLGRGEGRRRAGSLRQCLAAFFSTLMVSNFYLTRKIYSFWITAAHAALTIAFAFESNLCHLVHPNVLPVVFFLFQHLSQHELRKLRFRSSPWHQKYRHLSPGLSNCEKASTARTWHWQIVEVIPT